MKENEEVYHRHRTAGKRLPRACERRTVRPGDETSSRPEGGDSYSVGMGLLMAVVFSAAAAYLGLKVGQVFEAAIPIAIIAVGLSNALKKKNSLGQNVIIQSIGSCSGVIVAGVTYSPSWLCLSFRLPIPTSWWNSIRYSSVRCWAESRAFSSSYPSVNIS